MKLHKSKRRNDCQRKCSAGTCALLPGEYPHGGAGERLYRESSSSAGYGRGHFRVGGIASFIVDSDRYLLASYTQQNLKYVKVGQPVEVALDLYPGQIFQGKVDSVWWANGEGQYLPSDIIPQFYPADPKKPQGEFAVKIYLNDPARLASRLARRAPRPSMQAKAASL